MRRERDIRCAFPFPLPRPPSLSSRLGRRVGIATFALYGGGKRANKLPLPPPQSIHPPLPSPPPPLKPPPLHLLRQTQTTSSCGQSCNSQRFAAFQPRDDRPTADWTFSLLTREADIVVINIREILRRRQKRGRKRNTRQLRFSLSIIPFPATLLSSAALLLPPPPSSSSSALEQETIGVSRILPQRTPPPTHK